jgi:hypothetical protein
MNNQNVLTLSPSMKEALAFVATEDLAEKKLTEKGRRAFEAI